MPISCIEDNTDHFDLDFVVAVAEILECLEEVILGFPRVFPLGDEQPNADFALDRGLLQCVVDHRPVLDLGRVDS